MTDEKTEAEAGGERERPMPSKDHDAMGNDKRRNVVGEQYGATIRKRLLVYGIAIGLIIAAVIVSLTVVKNLDGAEIALEDTAPWTKAESLAPPRDIDFQANGPKNTIPADQIVNR